MSNTLTSRRSLLAALGVALPVATFATGAFANTASLPHAGKKHAHEAHAQQHHGKPHRTASALRHFRSKHV